MPQQQCLKISAFLASEFVPLSCFLHLLSSNIRAQRGFIQKPEIQDKSGASEGDYDAATPVLSFSFSGFEFVALLLWSLPDSNARAECKRRKFRGFVRRLQIIVHRRINGRTSGSGDSLPFIPRLFPWFPILRALPGLLIGLGPRPEHTRSTRT